MRSIRLSLIVYFLVLLALALGGVSWFAYQTTAHALRAKQASTNDLIQRQYDDQCKLIRATMDERILDKAETLAKKVRFREYLEPLFPIGIAGACLQPQGYLNAGLWARAGWD